MSRLTAEQIETRASFGSLRQRLGSDAEKPYKPLSQKRLASLIGTSLSTVGRIESTGNADRSIKEKVKRIHELVDLLVPSTPQHDRLTYLTTPQPAFLGCRPIAFMDNNETAEVAKRILKS